MKRLAAVLDVGVSFVAWRADAHRLDEYLQQTLIELEPNRIVLNVDLTPGVAVSGRVLPLIDTDHDGALTDTEQSAYTERVRRDLSLSMNGTTLALRSTGSNYPAVATMTRGVGTIALTFEADVPGGSIPSGTLRYANRHDAADASYLVNCLLPRGQDIRIVTQSRSPDQASYEVELASGVPKDGLNLRGMAMLSVALLGAALFAGGLFALHARNAARERT